MSQVEENANYLLHHEVIKLTNIITKVRLVFDTS